LSDVVDERRLLVYGDEVVAMVKAARNVQAEQRPAR
jgi:hypothetical protein